MSSNIDSFYLKIALKLKSEREKRHLTYQQLAAKTGLSSSSLQRYEAGNTKIIPVHVLGVLEDFYGLESGYFMGWTDSQKPVKTTPPFQRVPLKNDLKSRMVYGFAEEPTLKDESFIIAPDNNMLKERIKKGDTVYLDQYADTSSGDIIAIRTGGKDFLCYVYKSDKTWIFTSGNPGETPITSDNLPKDGILILGKVVGFKSQL